MTWLAITEALSKVWSWLKENWKVPFVVAYTIVIWVLARGNTGALRDALDARKEAHREEVNSLKENHKKELESRDQALVNYREAMARVEQEFRRRGERLEEHHKKRVREIASSDAALVREKIEKEFGFKYVEMD